MIKVLWACCYMTDVKSAMSDRNCQTVTVKWFAEVSSLMNVKAIIK